ncbi:interferon-related developmental regulator 1 [Lingula anatina]|uniref:Interferon-related developmental regulator 1 n=1 Tax=Lingula anatina TaxID=7574 RepID=A0A1S3JIK4_LINAN|nr:interferon-related developmental regulator 1 [Lingula anatina]|eukprot:XP_013410222.1 interferon-related developmental regulator 1 [Lingula anatina]
MLGNRKEASLEKRKRKTMPKGKKKGGRKSVDSRQSSDNDVDTPENMSVVSENWSTESIPEDGASADAEVDEVSTQENFEDKLKECIEGTTEKSAETRKNSIQGIMQAMRKKYTFDFFQDRKMTVTDSLKRCLSKGKGEEQALAGTCVSLLCVTLGGSEDCEAVYEEIKPMLQTVLLDNSAALKARASCATTLGLCTFVCVDDVMQIRAVMNTLESVFKASYFKGNGVAPTHSPEVASLHCSALSAWTLLLSISPPSYVEEFIDSHLSKLPQLLISSLVDLRIAAGEALALLYELARQDDEEFEGDDMDSLCAMLKGLATDSQKFRAKKDRKQQRSSFRDILRTVEDGDFPDETVKFGVHDESLYIDSWVKKVQYNALCQVMATGMNTHLQENVLIRDIFGLGAPIPVSTLPKTKIHRYERHLMNTAVAKARTKVRAKTRDKRTVSVSSTG